MTGNVVLGQYYRSRSWVHRLDPRVKIMSLFLLMIAVFLVNDYRFLLAFFLLTVIVVLSTGIPFGKFLRSLRMLTFLLLFMFVFQVLFRKTGKVLHSFDCRLTAENLAVTFVLLVLYFLSGKVIKKGRFFLFTAVLIGAMSMQLMKNGHEITSYTIKVYDDALKTSFLVLIRIVTILFISSLLTLSTKPMDLNRGLEKLLKPLGIFRINVSVFTMMISIALRFVPTLINEANKILKAQASRGADFRESGLKGKITQIVSLIVPMFVIAYRRALDLSDAMEARGYDPDQKRTSIAVLKIKGADIAVLTGVSLLTLILICLKIFGKTL